VRRRTAWTAGFLTVTVAAVGMELWAAWDHSPDTVPWTDLIAEHVPRPVTFAAVALLTAWLPGHFTWAYRRHSTEGGAAVRYAKGIVAAIAAGLTVAQQVLPLTPTQHGAVAIALAVAGALAVYLVPNSPAADPPSTPRRRVPPDAVPPRI